MCVSISYRSGKNHEENGRKQHLSELEGKGEMTILSETTKYVLTSTGVMVLPLGILLGLIIAVIGVRCDSMCLTIVGAVTVLAAIIFVFVYLKKPYLEFKAVVSDDYSATELYEKYDVVGHDGKIWILNERN